MELIDWFNYYTMRKHKVYKFASPRLFNICTRIGINWQRPYFTTDLAQSVPLMFLLYIYKMVVDGG